MATPGSNMSIVSIHASVKDATKRQKRAIAAQKVSIHASVKDATKISISIILPISFNPRICKRCDQDAAIKAQREEFQSTHL